MQVIEILPRRRQGPIYSWYHWCWWLCRARSQAISSYAIVLILLSQNIAGLLPQGLINTEGWMSWCYGNWGSQDISSHNDNSARHSPCLPWYSKVTLTWSLCIQRYWRLSLCHFQTWTPQYSDNKSDLYVWMETFMFEWRPLCLNGDLGLMWLSEVP